MAHDAAARHFERISSDYTKLRDTGLKGRIRRAEQRAVRDLARLEPGSLVLDAGCGDGETLAWIDSLGARPVGIDIAWGMASHCRSRGFDVSVQDMEQLGLRASFDWVLCIGSLEFTREPAGALAGFSAALRSGGRLVLLFPRRGWVGSLYAAYHRTHGVPIWLFSRREVSQLLENVGLEVEEWRDCFLSSVCLARRTDRPARPA
jgi:SAM-dependent methyltransferase